MVAPGEVCMPPHLLLLRERGGLAAAAGAVALAQAQLITNNAADSAVPLLGVLATHEPLRRPLAELGAAAVLAQVLSGMRSDGHQGVLYGRSMAALLLLAEDEHALSAVASAIGRPRIKKLATLREAIYDIAGCADVSGDDDNAPERNAVY